MLSLGWIGGIICTFIGRTLNVFIFYIESEPSMRPELEGGPIDLSDRITRTSENEHLDMCAQWRIRSAHTFAQSDQNLH